MRIVFIANSFSGGGAANGARQWANALQSVGVEVILLDHEKLISTITPLEAVFRGKIRDFLWDLSSRLTRQFNFSHRGNISLHFLPSNYNKYIDSLAPDYVFINWIQKNTISLRDIRKISSPKIFFFHDHWFFSGLSHFDEYTTRGRGIFVPLLESVSRSLRIRTLKSAHALVFMSEESRKSFGQKFAISSIALPYPADKSSFHLDLQLRESFRYHYKISQTETVLAFGANAPLSDRRKGFDLLYRALGKFTKEQRRSVVLIVFGSTDHFEEASLGIRVIRFGDISSKSVLRSILSGSDLVVIPSRMETFGLVSSEAQLCGTPVLVSNAACRETVASPHSKVFDGTIENLHHLLCLMVSKDKNQNRLLVRHEIARSSSELWEPKIIAKKLLSFLSNFDM